MALLKRKKIDFICDFLLCQACLESTMCIIVETLLIVPIRLFGGKKGFAVLRILSILHEIIFLIE